MLDRIAENWSNVVVPVIDVISDETLKYMHSSAKHISVGGFDWGLLFRWHPMPKRDAERPGAPVSPVRYLAFLFNSPQVCPKDGPPKKASDFLVRALGSVEGDARRWVNWGTL